MTPLKNPKVTSLYGWRTLNNKRQWHAGLDMVDLHNRTVRAIWDCVKCEAVIGWNGGRGNTAYLYYSGTLRALCQHMDILTVKTGSVVRQGQPIGQYGNTGDSYGAHLHIEVQKLEGPRWVAIAPMAYVEVKNLPGVQPGNENRDKKPNEDPVKPAANLTVLAIGPMSEGDRLTMEALAAELALSCTAYKTNGNETTLHLGPMTAGDRKAVETKAKALVLPCKVWDGNVTLIVGPQSDGDRRTMEKKTGELRLAVKTQDVGRGLYTQTIGPMSPGDKQTMEALAGSLLLPVGVA